MTALIVFFYLLGWFVCISMAAGFLWIEEEPKRAARWFVSAWVWPFICAYAVVRHGRGFIVKTFQVAELHEFVVQEQDLWRGADAPPVGKEKR